jgi:uncharacterized protein YbjT (DUF2867 family)
MTDQPILVIGATGKTGSRVARLLQEAGHPVRHGSRGAPIPFDWEDPATWAPALDGVEKAYVTHFPDLAFPGAVDRVAGFSKIARQTGLQHMVLLSGRGEHHARLGEEAVRASGIGHTLVRSAWFAQNFSEGYLRDPVLSGVLPMPGGNVAEPIIDIDDIAEVVARVLTEDGHDGALYEVTGPRLMTFAEMADDLADALGRPVRHIPITFEDFHAGLSANADDFIADVFTGIARETLDGRNAYLCDGVERVLHRKPRDFRDFARRAAAQGRWRDAA